MCVPCSLDRRHLSALLFRCTEQQEPAVRNELLSGKGLECRSRRDWGHLATEKERIMGAGEQCPGQRRGRVWAKWTSTQNSHTNTTSDREKKRVTRGMKAKLQINAWGWGQEELLWPRESKQVTGLAPGTEALSLESRVILQEKGWLSEQRMTWIQDEISKLYKVLNRPRGRQVILWGKNWFYKNRNYRKWSHLAIKTINCVLCT